MRPGLTSRYVILLRLRIALILFKMLVCALLLLSFASRSAADPTPPALTYLFTANLTTPDSSVINIGTNPLGDRSGVVITGGTFQGPKLTGKPAMRPPLWRAGIRDICN